MSCIWWHLTLILRGSLHCIICSLIHLVCLVWFVDWCCACWLTHIWLVHKNTYLHILCIHILYIWERASLRTTSIQYFHFGVNCTFKEKKRYSQHNDDSVCVCVCVSHQDPENEAAQSSAAFIIYTCAFRLWPRSLQRNPFIFSRHFCPKRPTVIHAYTDGGGCHARCRPAHQEQFGVQYLAQGHFNMQTRGIWTSDLPVTTHWLYPWAIAVQMETMTRVDILYFLLIVLWLYTHIVTRRHFFKHVLKISI